MFNRGKRIEIIKSSRQGSSGLKIGDLGYLENMFLFLNERFILASAIFLKGKKHRLEKKRFIIDLGMDEKSKLGILHQHTSRDFFASKQQLNLLPIIYDSRCGSDHIWQFINYPDLFNSCGGVWNNKEVKNLSKIKIPICDIKLSPIKKSLLSYNNIEFEAWLRSIITIPIFLIYVNLNPLVPGEQRFYAGLNSFNNHLIMIHDELRQYLDVFVDNAGIPRNISFTRPINDMSNTNKYRMITMIRLATSLQYMLHSRYDAHMIKTLNDVVRFRELYDVVDYYYTRDKNLSIFESKVTSSSKFIMDFILSSIMRSIVTDDVIQKKLKLLKNLPRFSSDSVGLNDLLINEALLCSISNVKQKITSKVSDLKEALLVLDMSQKKKKSIKSKPKKIHPFELSVLRSINDRTFNQTFSRIVRGRIHREGDPTFNELRVDRDRSRGISRPVEEYPTFSERMGIAEMGVAERPSSSTRIPTSSTTVQSMSDSERSNSERIAESRYSREEFIEDMLDPDRLDTTTLGSSEAVDEPNTPMSNRSLNESEPLDPPESAENTQEQIDPPELAEDDQEPVREQVQEPAGTQDTNREGGNESIENGENHRESVGSLVRRLVLGRGRHDDLPF